MLLWKADTSLSLPYGLGSPVTVAATPLLPGLHSNRRCQDNSTVPVVLFVQLTLHVHAKTSFEKNCFSAWASTLNMGLINKVDMVCLSPVGYGV